MSSETLPLQTERFLLGQVEKVTPVTPELVGISSDLAPSSIFDVEVWDPYVASYPEKVKQEVRRIELDANNFAADRRLAGAWERKPRTAYFDLGNNPLKKKGWGDPESRKRFFNDTLKSPGIDAWRSKIPHATSLADLSDPLGITFIKNKNNRDIEMDETAKQWLSLCTDAVAIRNRSTVMAEIVKSFVEDRQQSDNDYHWLSIACGTALPAMQGSKRAGIKPNLYLADFDNSALEATEELSKQINFSGNIIRPSIEALGKATMNIFNKGEMKQLDDYLVTTHKRPTLIDLMGIFEYTGDDIGVDSVDFLRSCYDMLAPGGKLIFGQMRSDRSVPDFVTGVISWPYIKMRSPQEFMEIIAKADISPALTTLYLPDDGVYTIGVISKNE